MKILVYGAGVIGTVYAAKLQEAGEEVTVLARAPRLNVIQESGLVIENVATRVRLQSYPMACDRLLPDDCYDLVIVSVRRDQVESIVSHLKANRRVQTILLMFNYPSGMRDLQRELGQERVVVGFPGVAGASDGATVRYALIPQQPTTIGERDGQITERVRGLAQSLAAAGFEIHLERNMEAWLTTHAFFITAVCGALYMSGGSCAQLAGDTSLLNLMCTGIRDGQKVVRSMGDPIHPFSLRVLFNWMPRSFAAAYWRRFFSRPIAEYIFGQHARTGITEIRALTEDCRTLIKTVGVASPSLDALYTAIDGFVEKQSLPMRASLRKQAENSDEGRIN